MSYSGNTGSAAVKRCARVYPGLGEQKKDFTAVLLGGAEAVEVFDRVAECLRRQGVDVVAVQLPGFGKTADELPKLSAAEVIEGIALEIAAACRSKRVVLLGHSMGALLGVTLLGGERLKQEVEISGFLQLAPAYVLRDWAAGLLCRLVIAGVSLMPRRVLNALKLFAPVCGPLIKGGLALRFLRMKIPWRGPYERRCLDAAFMEEPRDAGVAEVFTEFLPLSAGTYYFSFLYRALRVL
ncbi:MAG TPA: alpha/beta fold hydrolase, partial [Oligoflexia bacterium]|nr:alpha/beta fold hydrolase [Oligoflexia bacterium]